MKLIELFVKILSWIKIALSPTLLGCFIGLIVYINKTDDTGLSIAIAIAVLGLIGGIFLARWVSKKHGITEFHPGLRSTPDLDLYDEKKHSGTNN